MIDSHTCFCISALPYHRSWGLQKSQWYISGKMSMKKEDKSSIILKIIIQFWSPGRPGRASGSSRDPWNITFKEREKNLCWYVKQKAGSLCCLKKPILLLRYKLHTIKFTHLKCINRYCFKPLSFRVVCYTAKTDWYKLYINIDSERETLRNRWNKQLLHGQES